MKLPRAAWLGLPGVACLISAHAATGVDAKANQFLAFKNFSGWTRSAGPVKTQEVLTSPVIVGQIPWNEMVVSWNADAPGDTYINVEARAIYPSGPTRWYQMGLWCPSVKHPRESVLRQRDGQGDVKTDTLVLNEPVERFQLRIILGRDPFDKPNLKFVGVALTDNRLELTQLEPNKRAWGTVLPVLERSQMVYPNGGVICSPTTVSMIMSYWAKKLGRPELDNEVPDIVKAVYDSNWKGTGNWVFNTAYAGQFKGMKAYVTRMSDLSELEDWVAAGIPVGLSLCYDLLRGRPSGPSGHLVVLVGFTPEGDPVINDPGTTLNVRKTFVRKNLVTAWAYSRNAAYLIYPEDAVVPNDRFGHWDSWSARQRIQTEPAVYK